MELLAAFLNLSKSLIGIGLLGVPHVMSETGVATGLTLLAVVLSGAAYGMNLILVSYVCYIRSCRSSASHCHLERPVKTVAELSGVLLGAGWKRAVEAMTVVMQLAFCVGFVYIILDTAESVAHISRLFAAVALLPVAIILGLIKKLRDLWFVSAIGLVIFFFGVMVGTLLQGWSEGRHLEVVAGDALQRRQLGSWLSWTGSVLYSAEAVNHVMPNATSLKQPESMSMILLLVFMFYFMFVGGWEVLVTMYGFGNCNGHSDSVLKCLTPGPWSAVIQSAVACNLVVTMPIVLFPAVQMLEGILDSRTGVGVKVFRSMLRPVLSALVILLGLTVKDLTRFTGIVGATVMVILGFVVPIRLYSAAASCSLSRHVLHGLIVFAAVCVAVVETFSRMRTLLG
eukprot:TRINITY_DN37289_c0_g1_i1.p1 TRINITY_DN37289_c0_g1~~TRINITY_DN37289_c0_g1_i1.p1  ORF type:complete len:439 (-),score=36.92 TRINITY_DN37289_c0_g1_i1:47-1240(-)